MVYAQPSLHSSLSINGNSILLLEALLPSSWSRSVRPYPWLQGDLGSMLGQWENSVPVASGLVRRWAHDLDQTNEPTLWDFSEVMRRQSSLLLGLLCKRGINCRHRGLSKPPHRNSLPKNESNEGRQSTMKQCRLRCQFNPWTPHSWYSSVTEPGNTCEPVWVGFLELADPEE